MTNKHTGTKSSSHRSLWHSLLWWLTVVAFLLLSLCGLATYVNPSRFPLIGVFVLCFPAFLISSVALLIMCVLFRVKRWWIFAITLLLNGWSTRIFFPINLSKDIPQNTIKVLSYNVKNFFDDKGYPNDSSPITTYLLSSQADIICLQEAKNHDKKYFEKIWSRLHQQYAYQDSIMLPSSSYLDVYSRYPILKSEVIANGESNHCAAFTLLEHGDTLIVINCHLRSMQLSQEEKQSFAGMVHDADTLSTSDKQRESMMLITKLSAASVKRAEQVDKLCEYLERMRDKRIILCGDFNDTPISYAHNRISDYLTDCFAATATGFGRSFNTNSMFVRIDQMFCSKHFSPYACQVDQSVLLSDHYPISCYFSRK